MEKVLYALLGVIVGQVLGHYTAIWRSKRFRYETAVDKFRSIVIAESMNSDMASIDYSPENCEKLIKSFITVQNAAFEFSFILDQKKADSFRDKTSELYSDFFKLEEMDFVEMQHSIKRQTYELLYFTEEGDVKLREKVHKARLLIETFFRKMIKCRY